MQQLLLALLFTAFAAISASACSCLNQSHRSEFRQSAAVFVGTVIALVEDASFVPPKPSGKVPANIQRLFDSQRRYFVKFRVTRGYKGVRGSEITLAQVRGDGPCPGIYFAEGESYLVYARRADGKLNDSGICSRTRGLAYAADQLRDLGSFWFRLRALFPG